MSKTHEQIVAELDAKIPRDSVSERDGGGGRRLSYLEGHYVIDRLNKVLGHLAWSKEIVDVRLLETPKPSYLVKVRLSVHTASGLVVKEGYGYGSDKSSNNPHELAIKEAVTDALKVAAKDLGMSMGLALYDKSQENVSDESSDKPKERKTLSNKADETVPAKATTSEPSPTTTTDTKKLEETIKSYVRVGVKQGKISVETFRDYIKGSFKVEQLAELKADQLAKVLEHVQHVTKG